MEVAGFSGDGHFSGCDRCHTGPRSLGAFGASGRRGYPTRPATGPQAPAVACTPSQYGDATFVTLQVAPLRV